MRLTVNYKNERRTRGRPKVPWMGGIEKEMSKINLRPGNWEPKGVEHYKKRI